MDMEDAERIAGGNFPLHRLLFKKDFPALVHLFRQGVFNVDNINSIDLNGNTPLLLAGKLSNQDDEYLKAVNYFFEQGANGKLKDPYGWSLMHEAIS